ncbi:MAG: M23 family metallopeptidase [Spirochaetia bacterium]|jgi:murein DD-endopeptidase MepM/ murein hydrolase activator NlpD|nr:M23 family metallopeptidase [Spirochaetia bacterium]
MKRILRSSNGTETLERLVSLKTLSLSLAVLAFGFSFLSSSISGTAHPMTESAGAADFSDAGGSMPEGALVDQEPNPNPPDQGLFYVVYRVVKGDTISEIATRFDVTSDSIITFNGITNARTLSIGKYLKIPTLNGILYTAKKGDTVQALAASYSISEDRIKELNGIGDAPMDEGRSLFLPDARLSSWTLREISGDLFSWPIRGWITSWYGWRNDPFSGDRSFHTGIDIGANRGSPVRAAMEGVVAATGYSAVSGNYVVVRHHSGYSTMYAHLDRIDVKAGRSVTQATTLGAVGSTGYSTGPHLHFTVSKNGRTVNPMTVLR